MKMALLAMTEKLIRSFGKKQIHGTPSWCRPPMSKSLEVGSAARDAPIRLDPWKAAGFLEMSVEVLLDTYGHHHPEFLREAAS